MGELNDSEEKSECSSSPSASVPKEQRSQQVKTVDCSPPKTVTGMKNDGQAQPEPSPIGTKEEKQSSEETCSAPETTPLLKEFHDKDRPVRLFIGQVPETMVEQHITALFHSKGIQLLDVSVIRDKNTGRHRHCCFITVTNREAADKAITEFHNKRYLEAMANPMQVREANQPKSKAAYAAMRAYSQLLGTAMPVFADSTTESPIRDSQSKNFFNYRYGVPQFVPFNPFLQTQSSYMHHQAMTAPYYYGYLPVGPHGYSTQPSPTVNYVTQGISKTAKDVDSLEPMAYASYPVGDLTLPFQHIPAQQLSSCSLPSKDSHGTYVYSRAGSVDYNPYFIPTSAALLPRTTTYVEGPPGANLFVNNLPPNFIDDDLFKLFSIHGKVLSYKVFVDKYTKISKGFGFVSFSTVSEAQQAINLKNGYRLANGHEIFVELKRPKRLKYPEYI